MPHRPYEIAAQNLVDLLFGVTAIEQDLRNYRILRHILELFRRRGNTVEIRAETHMIDARDLHNVIDVIDDVVHAAAGDWILLLVLLQCRLEVFVIRVLLPHFPHDIEHLGSGATPSGTMKPE